MNLDKLIKLAQHPEIQFSISHISYDGHEAHIVVSHNGNPADKAIKINMILHLTLAFYNYDDRYIYGSIPV